jgi:hypothetical protein
MSGNLDKAQKINNVDRTNSANSRHLSLTQMIAINETDRLNQFQGGTLDKSSMLNDESGKLIIDGNIYIYIYMYICIYLCRYIYMLIHIYIF